MTGNPFFMNLLEVSIRTDFGALPGKGVKVLPLSSARVTNSMLVVCRRLVIVV